MGVISNKSTRKYTGWAKEGVVGRLSDQYGIIFVMPDGGYDSWYFDSVITPEYQSNAS